MFSTLHPLIVHFPIALLITYSILELASLIPLVRYNSHVRYIKLFLLAAWLAFIQLALNTWEAAADVANVTRSILKWHETFANASTRIYGIGGVGYLIKRYMTDLQTTNRGMKISKTFVHTIIARIYPLISNYNLLLLVALAGIASLGVTGALGGALVYWPDYDIMTRLITQLLGINH